MATPNNDDGYTMITNELIEEALCKINLSGSEYRILWVIWRKTYGWHKEEDAIALSQFEVFTGLDRRNIARAIKSLQEKNIIMKDTGEYITKFRFNNDYETWKIKGGVKIDTSVNTDTKVVSNKTPRLVSKKTPTKERRKNKERVKSSQKISGQKEESPLDRLMNRCIERGDY